MLEFCPLCDKNGCKNKILLSQINFEEAVWLCESKECPWPFGSEDFTFVTRRVGETWSSEWQTHKAPILKSTESFPTSLNELGLDTPPVTPGSGYEIAHKESVFRETLCSVPSPNLITNNVAATKGNSQSTNYVDKSRHFDSKECGTIDVESRDRKVASNGGSVTRSVLIDKQESESQDSSNGINNNLVNNKRRSTLDNEFGLTGNNGFENFDKCVPSSEEFDNVLDIADASTESIFDIGKSVRKNLFSETKEDYKALSDSLINPKHETTVKCTNWLSDNTKSAVCKNRSNSSDESNQKIIYKLNVTPQISANNPRSGSIENMNVTKQLPVIKSIEKANIKLIAGVTVSDQRNSNKYIADLEAVNLSRSCNAVSSVIKKEKEIKPGDATKTSKRTKERIIVATQNADNQRNVSNQCLPDTCRTWKNNSGISKVANETVVIDGLPPISLSYEIPSFIEESVLPSTDSRNQGQEDLGRGSEADNRAIRNSVKVDTNDCGEGESDLPATINQTKLKTQTMKKPTKRTILRGSKYQGFDFGTLKKKLKSNASHNEESMKTSLLNLPSPDNVSTCSDLTYTSETSCATTATGASRSESVGSTIDSSSRSILGMENFMTTSSFDLKNSNALSQENNETLESNLNLDTVLDDLLFDASNALPQNLGDDWLTSLFD